MAFWPGRGRVSTLVPGSGSGFGVQVRGSGFGVRIPGSEFRGQVPGSEFTGRSSDDDDVGSDERGPSGPG